MHVQPGILTKRFNRIRRETGGQRREIDAAALQLSLQSVGIADHPHSQRGDSRRTVPIIRVCFQVDHSLRLIVAFELEWSGAYGMRLLRFVTAVRDHRYGHQIR